MPTPTSHGLPGDTTRAPSNPGSDHAAALPRAPPSRSSSTHAAPYSSCFPAPLCPHRRPSLPVPADPRGAEERAGGRGGKVLRVRQPAAPRAQREGRPRPRERLRRVDDVCGGRPTRLPLLTPLPPPRSDLSSRSRLAPCGTGSTSPKRLHLQACARLHAAYQCSVRRRSRPPFPPPPP